MTRNEITNGLNALAHAGVIKGWLPLSVHNGYGYQDLWRITPTEGPAEDHDTPYVEQYLRMAHQLQEPA